LKTKKKTEKKNGNKTPRQFLGFLRAATFLRGKRKKKKKKGKKKRKKRKQKRPKPMKTKKKKKKKNGKKTPRPFLGFLRAATFF